MPDQPSEPAVLSGEWFADWVSTIRIEPCGPTHNESDLRSVVAEVLDEVGVVHAASDPHVFMRWLEDKAKEVRRG